MDQWKSAYDEAHSLIADGEVDISARETLIGIRSPYSIELSATVYPGLLVVSPKVREAIDSRLDDRIAALDATLSTLDVVDKVGTGTSVLTGAYVIGRHIFRVGAKKFVEHLGKEGLKQHGSEALAAATVEGAKASAKESAKVAIVLGVGYGAGKAVNASCDYLGISPTTRRYAVLISDIAQLVLLRKARRKAEWEGRKRQAEEDRKTRQDEKTQKRESDAPATGRPLINGKAVPELNVGTDTEMAREALGHFKTTTQGWTAADKAAYWQALAAQIEARHAPGWISALFRGANGEFIFSGGNINVHGMVITSEGKVLRIPQDCTITPDFTNPGAATVKYKNP